MTTPWGVGIWDEVIDLVQFLAPKSPSGSLLRLLCGAAGSSTWQEPEALPLGLECYLSTLSFFSFQIRNRIRFGFIWKSFPETPTQVSSRSSTPLLPTLSPHLRLSLRHHWHWTDHLVKPPSLLTSLKTTLAGSGLTRNLVLHTKFSLVCLCVCPAYGGACSDHPWDFLSKASNNRVLNKLLTFVQGRKQEFGSVLLLIRNEVKEHWS